VHDISVSREKRRVLVLDIWELIMSYNGYPVREHEETPWWLKCLGYRPYRRRVYATQLDPYFHWEYED
jgi:hypothetical protein